MRIFSYLLLPLLSSLLLAGSFAMIPHEDPRADQIAFMMDFHRTLTPFPFLRVTHKLFNVLLVNVTSGLPPDFDLVSYAVITNLIDTFNRDKRSDARAPAYIKSVVPVEAMFNNKLVWKEWMAHNNLTDFMPKVFKVSTDPKSLPYPIVLKTNRHASAGVYIIHNEQDLAKIGDKMRSRNESYLLEEALTGLGLSEMTAWGSAYEGRLLSLNCAVRTFNISNIVKSAYHGSTVQEKDQKVSTNTPYIKGLHLSAQSTHWLPCGKDVVSVTSRMMAAANFTGAMCLQVKLDSQMRFKVLEVNARFCGTVASFDGLFVSTYVPLAFAIAKANPTSQLAHKLHRGLFSRAFKEIQVHEARILRTGGGPLGTAGWVEQELFDPEAKLNNIHRFYHQHIANNLLSPSALSAASEKLKNMEKAGKKKKEENK